MKNISQTTMWAIAVLSRDDEFRMLTERGEIARVEDIPLWEDRHEAKKIGRKIQTEWEKNDLWSVFGATKKTVYVIKARVKVELVNMVKRANYEATRPFG